MGRAAPTARPCAAARRSCSICCRPARSPSPRAERSTAQLSGGVVTAGHRLATEWIAPARADAPPLVMPHEGLRSVALWKDFPRKLAAATGAGVLVYWRYGSGASDIFAEKRQPDYMH